MPSCWYAFRSACSSPSPGQTNCLSPVERKSLRDDKQNDRNKCNRRSLDCGTHDDAVSAFARDDNLLMCKRRTSNNKGKSSSLRDNKQKDGNKGNRSTLDCASDDGAA